MSDLRSTANPAPPQRRIGITGGVGMGKTTISDYLARTYHVPILDADLYAREAVEPGFAVLADIIERYGSSIVVNGQLDRRRLGTIIFNSPAERHWLEQQIHPYVRDRLETELHQLDQATYPTIVLVIPLLFEARMTDLVSEIWVVRTSDAQQRERLRDRDQLDPAQIEARINSQMAIAKKVEQADVVLDNTSTLADLFQQIDRAVNRVGVNEGVSG